MGILGFNYFAVGAMTGKTAGTEEVWEVALWTHLSVKRLRRGLGRIPGMLLSKQVERVPGYTRAWHPL